MTTNERSLLISHDMTQAIEHGSRLRTLYDSVGELPRDRMLLIVDRSGRRTARAMQTLSDLEFESYRGLKGGVLAWRASGFRLAVE